MRKGILPAIKRPTMQTALRSTSALVAREAASVCSPQLLTCSWYELTE
jgi:hypothetical protein